MFLSRAIAKRSFHDTRMNMSVCEISVKDLKCLFDGKNFKTIQCKGLQMVDVREAHELEVCKFKSPGKLLNLKNKE
jgi:hypothetical protein